MIASMARSTWIRPCATLKVYLLSSSVQLAYCMELDARLCETVGMMRNMPRFSVSSHIWKARSAMMQSPAERRSRMPIFCTSSRSVNPPGKPSDTNTTVPSGVTPTRNLIVCPFLYSELGAQSAVSLVGVEVELLLHGLELLKVLRRHCRALLKMLRRQCRALPLVFEAAGRELSLRRICPRRQTEPEFCERFFDGRDANARPLVADAGIRSILRGKTHGLDVLTRGRSVGRKPARMQVKRESVGHREAAISDSIRTRAHVALGLLRPSGCPLHDDRRAVLADRHARRQKVEDAQPQVRLFHRGRRHDGLHLKVALLGVLEP
ncbi:hypothetical protein T492DRAFT_1017922 [Pavlovales sp. CCMP2436]|nr:hypothetical protein T492DRAFT_1017922 [Pavlovales sp. CCMP2436]